MEGGFLPNAEETLGFCQKGGFWLELSMNLWYFWCRSMTAWKVPRWFCYSPGIMHPWLVWWVWCWCRNVAEGLWILEGVNISKQWVRAECMERSHMAAENTGEHRRMLGMKFYVTVMVSLPLPWLIMMLIDFEWWLNFQGNKVCLHTWYCKSAKVTLGFREFRSSESEVTQLIF